MRDPNRIPQVLKDIEEIWIRHPDLRLGQLLWAINGRDPFHLEDVDIKEKAKAWEKLPR